MLILKMLLKQSIDKMKIHVNQINHLIMVQKHARIGTGACPCLLQGNENENFNS